MATVCCVYSVCTVFLNRISELRRLRLSAPSLLPCFVFLHQQAEAVSVADTRGRSTVCEI
ncbi:hypothetical protein JOB18_013242 [Solea senegalensis]|uniref:Uncharacterized protein n=1 Tax=Solea senegalensis TaxID=28829 RepID=A0AAV6QPL8_SOLSE|nr:hypothetical protein JOB18_013242 [Solea senegalensis]